MKPISSVFALAITAAVGGAGGYYYATHTHASGGAAAQPTRSCTPDKILYYRDPGGGSSFSAEPKKDDAGRDYLPVCDDEEVSFDTRPKVKSAGARKILYYRNPMGLPDTSPEPKKDSMGMDYIPVYEGEEPDDGKTVKVSLDKVQRSGVRSEVVEARVLVNPVRAVGTVKYDERRLTVVAMRSEGYVEDLFVNTTGQQVAAGEPLFRVYSRDIQLAQVDLNIATGAQNRVSGALGLQTVDGAMQRLRNLGVPESRIQEVRTKGMNPRTLDWPSPAAGAVIDKRIVNGQRVMAGDELYRIADLSHMWVIAEVAELDLAAIKIGMTATVTLRAYPHAPVEGTVTFIYPDLRPETRTARVRIELANPDGRLKADMYADVVFRAGADREPVVAVPDSAVIDSGTRQIVFVTKGEGRFEPRPVKLGARGDGYVEVLEGVNEGESVVVSANFLIDSESNLNAALKGFSQQETSP
jgi:Cu(I)/Ag(I) efflux system membrane fusion protein